MSDVHRIGGNKMTNKQIAKTWFTIIGLAFCWGFYCAAVGKTHEGGVMILLQLASCVFSIWGMVRLWKTEKNNG